MEYIDKTKEDLIVELLALRKSYDAIKEKIDRDISLMSLTEERAVKSEEKFRRAFMTSPDAVNINRFSDGMYVSINEGFTKAMGYSEEETIGKTSVELNIWYDPEGRKNLVKELQEKGRVENFEARFLRKDGGIITGLMSASVIDMEGVPHILNITKDISYRKAIEEQLLKEQFLINALMDNITDHVYFKDLESRFIRINKSQALSFGLDNPDQATGKTDFDFFTKEHALQAFDDEQTIIRTGKHLSKEEKETWENRFDTWVSTTKMPLLDKEGKIIGTFGISRDVTDHKKAEEELAAKHNLLLTLINNLPDRIYAKDTNSRFIICNNALVKRMGKSKMEEIIGKSDFDFLSNELASAFYANEQEIIKTGQPLLNHEESMGNISGVVRWNLTTKVPLRDKKGNVIGIVGVGRDITERKLAEEEIRFKNELLQTINAEKDKFFSILAHDLRGPLSAFMNATQILTEEINAMTKEDIMDITLSMKNSAANIYNLLENLLEWSRVKRGTISFNPESFLLLPKINKCIELVNEQARKKNIIIRTSIPENLGVHADTHMIETVIRNLVSNAIKFTTVGGEISISASGSEDKKVEISIRDSGIGMSPELISKLFLINEKVSRSGTEGEPSTGLGLMLCKEFIEKHGGMIRVISEEGKGSIFSFTI